MRHIITMCVVTGAVLICTAAPSRERITREYRDSVDFTPVYYWNDNAGLNREILLQAEKVRDVFEWDGMYCYPVPETICEKRECEAMRFCCTDMDADGLYERCSLRIGGSCNGNGEPVTAYCKQTRR